MDARPDGRRDDDRDDDAHPRALPRDPPALVRHEGPQQPVAEHADAVGGGEHRDDDADEHHGYAEVVGQARAHAGDPAAVLWSPQRGTGTTHASRVSSARYGRLRVRPGGDPG